MLEELDSLHPGDGNKEIPRSRMYMDTSPKTIAELNLETELVEHYIGLKSYLAEIGSLSDDSNYSPSQVAQITNSLTAVLDKIIKMQQSVVNMAWPAIRCVRFLRTAVVGCGSGPSTMVLPFSATPAWR